MRPQTDQLPPFDMDAECACIGALLYGPESIELVNRIIPRHQCERFYDERHRKIYRVLSDMQDECVPIDIITLRNELSRRGWLEDVGGQQYLIDLYNSVTGTTHAEHHARIVHAHSVRRDMILLSDALAKIGFDRHSDLEYALDTARKLITDSEDYSRAANHKGAMQIGDLLAETMAMINRADGGYGIRTGLQELDDLTTGFHEGELIVIAARPSIGKTALGMTMAAHAAYVDGHKAAFFSLEMPATMLLFRMLCAEARVPMWKARKGMLDEGSKLAMKDAGGKLATHNLIFDDRPALPISEFRATARRMHRDHGIEIVFVDYLQLMRDQAAGRERREAEVASVSRGLKATARELNIPVVAMAQLNRESEKRPGAKPRMSDLRESGAIEQDADCLILIHRDRDGDDRSKAQLIIAKQRNGPIGELDVHFDAQYTTFSSFDNRGVARVRPPTLGPLQQTAQKQPDPVEDEQDDDDTPF